VASPYAVTLAFQAALWIAYVVVPAHVGGLIHGAPLGPFDTWALVAVVWLTARRRRIAGGRLVAAGTIVTLALGALIPSDRGFRARYFADAEMRGAMEVSTEYRSRTFTRIDERLDFSPRRLDFPLAFFNDLARFNFRGQDQPDRERLPFAVSWDGQWQVRAAKTTTLYVDAPGASADLVLDATRLAFVTPHDGTPTAVVALTPGWHRLDIRYSSPLGSPRSFSAGEIVRGRRVPFDAGTVISRRLNGWQVWLARLVRVGRTALDACALAWLALLVAIDLRDLRRGRRADGATMNLRQQTLAWFAVVVIVEAYLFASPWFSRLDILAGGDDPLTYESYARSIQLSGPLLDSVNGPYYYQAFYPYFLAATHTLFGEGMFGLMFVQRLLVAFVVWMTVEIAAQIGGARVWPAALACASFLAYVKFAPLVASPSTESLFIPLLAAWTVALIQMCRRPDGRRAAGTGALGGLTALTRSTALLAWIAVLPACWTALRGSTRRGFFVAVALACACAVFALISVRNWIVVHQFVPMPTEFSITLLGGNEPSADLRLDLSRRGPLYDRLGLNSITRQVVEYAIAAPGAFARNLGRKALFALGFYEPYAPGWGRSAVFIGVSLASVIGFVLALRGRAAPASIVCLPGLVALSQFIAVVIVYPKGERLILPFHTLLVAYAAVAVDRFGRFVTAAMRGLTGVAQRFLGPERGTREGDSAASPGLKAAAAIVSIAALAIYTFVIRTRGITDHFLMLREQIRDWSIALGSFSSLPLVGTASTAGGHTFGPVFYWVLWLIRVTIGPFTGNLPHAGGIGLSALQSVADVVLCLGIRRATGSWLFAIATVLIIASSPFDLALSSVIWNPVLAVVFAKIGTGLVLSWQDTLTRPRRVALAAIAWFTVQSHSAALPFALALLSWIFWTQFRRGGRAFVDSLVEAALVIAVLQIPSVFAAESIRPTKIISSTLDAPPPVRVAEAFHAFNDGVGSIAFAPFAIPQPALILLASVAALLIARGLFSAVGIVTIAPIALTVAMWSILRQGSDAYFFLTVVPATLLTIAWTLRVVPQTARSMLALALLGLAVLVQKPRIESATQVFRMPEYGVLVRGSRAVAARGEPVRAIEVPFLHPLSDPEYVFTLLGGRIQHDAPEVARLSENGDVTYVR